VSTPTLVLEVVPASLRDSLLAGLTAKMWAERGYTVILRKETPPQQNEELDQIGSWVGSQSWFDGSIVNWNAGSVGRLMEQLRAHDFPNGFRVLLAAAK
jgi:hypothetical protein